MGSRAGLAAALAEFVKEGDIVLTVGAGDITKTGPELLALLGAKMVTKFVGVYPTTKFFKSPRKEAMYTTLLMSTGLTFGSISALFGLTHGIITQQQYSYLIAAVIGSAIVPTLIANAFFLPRHLLQGADDQAEVFDTAATTRAQQSK